MKPINQTILRLLAVILMTAGLFGGNNHAYAWGGDGSSNNPYVIQSEKDWKTFCQKTNDGYFRDAYGELGADITVTITSDDNDAMDLMCGRSYYPFIGYFDGRGINES